MILSFKLKIIILLQKEQNKTKQTKKGKKENTEEKRDFLDSILLLDVVPSVFLVPSHWNGVNTLLDSFSMICHLK